LVLSSIDGALMNEKHVFKCESWNGAGLKKKEHGRIRTQATDGASIQK
jgi:hypothetical protein